MTRACAVKQLHGKTYRCFFELALAVMGGKWKPIVLYHLGHAGVLRFGELKRDMPEVTDRMLTRQLRELEADGLIHREVYRQVPPKVEYSLTAQGLGLFPILCARFREAATPPPSMISIALTNLGAEGKP